MRASVDRRPGSDEMNLIVNELIPLDELSARFTSGVLIRVREDVHGVDALTKLREIVRGYPGTKPLRLRLELADGGCVMIDCPKRRVDRPRAAPARRRTSRPGQLPPFGRFASSGSPGHKRPASQPDSELIKGHRTRFLNMWQGHLADSCAFCHALTLLICTKREFLRKLDLTQISLVGTM